MKKIFPFIYLAVSAHALLSGCKNKNNSVSHEDMIGLYKIEEVFFIDSTKIDTSLMKQCTAWTLSLMKNNNFEFIGHGDTIVGYWTFTESADKKNRMLFQSGSMPENTIYSLFDKTSLAFEKPYSIFDTAFQSVILKRTDP